MLGVPSLRNLQVYLPKVERVEARLGDQVRPVTEGVLGFRVEGLGLRVFGV